MELRTKKQIDSLRIADDMPLFICDADEVILYFARHFRSFLNYHGWNLNLSGYRLDNAISHIKHGYQADKTVAQSLVKKFIKTETLNQKPTREAKETLEKISHIARIVILTNVPDYAHELRQQNFDSLGLKYPIISNSGPKGAAIRYLVKDKSLPYFFVDDSPFQIESAIKENPKLISIHFSACSLVSNILPVVSHASYSPKTWAKVFSIVKKEIRHFKIKS